MSKIKSYHVIGLMSGSSLDGLDICYVRFAPDSYRDDARFEYEILQAECAEYENDFRERLRNVPAETAYELAELHSELGKYFGNKTNEFILKNKIEQVDLVVSHGQTIFHQPGKGFTMQIGCGAQIAARTGCKTVCDLRTSDVAYGGQGAPIVPIAEKYLFPDHQIFLNIGGIANISFHAEDKILAYDVCAANTLLNHFSKQKGLDYDEEGRLARTGKVIPELLDALNRIPFCGQTPPKSLGTEHIRRDWFPLFEQFESAVEDKLATAVEHIAIQSSKFKVPRLPRHDGQGSSNMLVTGGGALNKFLIERIQAHCPVKVVVPDLSTVKYKEALAMALIGLLRVMEIPNVLASVTGASKDSVGGTVYLP